ncbi:MAG: hypothetical protein CK552_01855 [Actinobacteria bacterium]|nr:MAG: hypothetical protein CK552_01855 [Actinomycetota bacterium]
MKESLIDAVAVLPPTPKRSFSPWRIERRPDPERISLYRISAVLLGLAVSLVVAPFFTSTPPAEFYGAIWSGTFGSPLGMSNVLTIATPLILAGLAASIPYRLGLWNVGIDGQMLMGAWTATAVAFAMPQAPGFLMIPTMMIAGMIGGALWIIIPTFARLVLGVSEVITTFLLNFVAVGWVAFWCTGPWYPKSSAGGVRAEPIPIQGEIGKMDIQGIVVTWGILISIALPFVFWAAFRFTRWGYEVTMIGDNHRAGRYGGMNVRRLLVTSMLMGGLLAGFGGTIYMMGTSGQLSTSLTNNTGFNGLVIAVLAGSNELAVLALAFIYSLLLAGGGSLGIVGVDSDLVFAIIGITLIFGSFGEAYARLRLVRTKSAGARSDSKVKEAPWTINSSH